jgi:hypothetical protein
MTSCKKKKKEEEKNWSHLWSWADLSQWGGGEN